jgi:hypothetical protein
LDGRELRILDAEQLIEDSLLGDADSSDAPELAVNDDGGLWAAWRSSEVVVRYRAPSGTWSDTQALGEHRRGGPRIAANESGAALIAYTAGTAMEETVMVRHGRPGSDWSAPVALRTRSERGATSIQSHAVALDAFGDGLALWASSIRLPVEDGGIAETVSEVRAQNYDVEMSWTTGSEILELETLGRDSLVLDPQGNGFAAGTFEGVPRAIRWLRAARFGIPQPLGVEATRPPELAIDDRGRAVALWVAGASIWLSRFDEPD